MKESIIKLVLKKQIDKWLESITDNFLRGEIKKNVILTGGAIPSLLLNEKVNDYDLYFKTFECVERVARYYTDKFNDEKGFLKTTGKIPPYNPEVKIEDRINLNGETERRVIMFMKSAGVAGETEETYKYFESQQEVSADDFLESFRENVSETVDDLVSQVSDKKLPKYRPMFFTDNAITLSDKIQIILRFYGSPDEIHRNYDFVHTTCSYDYDKDTIILPQKALLALLTKTLIYTGSLYPIASVFRTRKFIKRGWSITAGQQLKMVYQASGIDWTDIAMVREQLIGVDNAYMGELLRELENRDPKQKLDATYLAKLIDEIFE
jgi:hypothetical protein